MRKTPLTFALSAFALMAVLMFASFGAAQDDEPEVPQDLLDAAIQATLAALPPQALTFDTQPEMILEDGIDYRAVLVTSRGNINLDLYEAEAPITVNNFVFLAQQGFYDGVIFHRVIDDFMIQTGDRNGVAQGQPGTGSPGYQWDDEAAALELMHDQPGILSMANAGPDTNGSQFFVTHVVTDWLDGNHAVFGEVVSDDDLQIVQNVRQGDVIFYVEILELEG